MISSMKVFYALAATPATSQSDVWTALGIALALGFAATFGLRWAVAMTHYMHVVRQRQQPDIPEEAEHIWSWGTLQFFVWTMTNWDMIIELQSMPQPDPAVERARLRMVRRGRMIPIGVCGGAILAFLCFAAGASLG